MYSLVKAVALWSRTPDAPLPQLWISKDPRVHSSAGPTDGTRRPREHSTPSLIVSLARCRPNKLKILIGFYQLSLIHI